MESLCQSDFSNDVVSSLGGRAYGVGESAHIEPRAVVFAHSAWTIRRPTDRSGPASSIFCPSRIFYSRLKVGMIFSSCVTMDFTRFSRHKSTSSSKLLECQRAQQV